MSEPVVGMLAALWNYINQVSLFQQFQLIRRSFCGFLDAVSQVLSSRLQRDLEQGHEGDEDDGDHLSWQHLTLSGNQLWSYVCLF